MTESPSRRSLRLRGYDYAQPGAYFVTLCTYGRACLFGDVVCDNVHLSEAGHIAERRWNSIPEHFPHISLDSHIVMPHHLHGIIVITARRGVGATHASPLPRHGEPSDRPPGPAPLSIAAIVGSYKSAVTRRLRTLPAMSGLPVWQRNYYEHVIRNDAAMERIRAYIVENPLRWLEDPENPFRVESTII